jgi:hypothetical protein
MEPQQAPEEVAPIPAPPAIGQDQKFCMDCGKVILRHAEICPGCGCRQLPSAQPSTFITPSTPEIQSPFVTRMAILLAGIPGATEQKTR